MRDEFRLSEDPAGHTAITRTTTLHVTGFAQTAKAVAMAVGLKAIHRYVFTNWIRIAANT
jgi:hypothetical protein